MCADGRGSRPLRSFGAFEATDELLGPSIFQQAQELIRQVPRATTFAAEVVARAVVSEILNGLVQQTKVWDQPQVALSLARLNCSLRSRTWTTDTLAFLDDCISAVESRAVRAYPTLLAISSAVLEVDWNKGHLDAAGHLFHVQEAPYLRALGRRRCERRGCTRAL